MAWVKAFEAGWPQRPQSQSRRDPLLEAVAIGIAMPIPIPIAIPIPIPTSASARDWRAGRLTIPEHFLRPVCSCFLLDMRDEGCTGWQPNPGLI